MSESRNYMPGLLLSKGRSPNIFGCSLSIWIVFNLFALLAAILQMCSNLSVIYLRCFPEPRAKFQLLLAWPEQNLLPLVRLKISSHLGNHITPMPHADLWATKTLPRALVKSCVPSPPHPVQGHDLTFVYPRALLAQFSHHLYLLKWLSLQSWPSGCPSGFGSIINLILIFSRAWSKSLINMLNRSGHMTQPCATENLSGVRAHILMAQLPKEAFRCAVFVLNNISCFFQPLN